MEAIGDFFRQVRETKGLTLEDVASKTRIHPDFLTALEEGNYTKLPDQVFAKGFVRSYARSLGLDEEDAMRRFEGSAGAFYDKQTEREQLRLRQAEDERRRKANRKVVAAATGVALLGLILFVTREQTSMAPHRPSGELDQTDAKRAHTPVLGETEGQTPRQRAASPKTASGAVEPAAPASARPMSESTLISQSADGLPSAIADPVGGLLMGSADAPLVLNLEALELTWVVVQADDGSPQEALLRPGERVQWKGTDRFTVTLGNAGGVRVELNGKVQGPFGPTGKVIRDIVLKRS